MGRVTLALVALIGTITIGTLPSWDETRARAIAQHNTIAAITTSSGGQSAPARTTGGLSDTTDTSWMGPALRGELASAKAATPKVIRLASGPATDTEDALTAPSAAKSKSAGMATSIQSELTRVGCYGGPIDGTWSPATRRAMQTFIENVNAMLPTAEPDFILLTLVRGHTGTACAARAPSQTASAALSASAGRPTLATTSPAPVAKTAPRLVAPTTIVTASIARSIPADVVAEPQATTKEPITQPRADAQSKPRRGQSGSAERLVEIRTADARPAPRATQPRAERREPTGAVSRREQFAQVARSEAPVRRERPTARRSGGGSLYASVFDRIGRNAP